MIDLFYLWLWSFMAMFIAGFIAIWNNQPRMRDDDKILWRDLTLLGKIVAVIVLLPAFVGLIIAEVLEILLLKA